MDRRETTRYYTLRYEFSDSLHSAGERIAASGLTVRIGQQNDCDVKLENESDYADELFAIIRPCRYGDGWQLIPCSEYVGVSVNGTDVTLVHYLSDGDRISFGGERQELLFNIREDEEYDSRLGTVRMEPAVSQRAVMMLVLIPLILVGILGGYVFRSGNAERVRLAALEAVKSSVVQISVDSVYYVEITPVGERIARRYSYAGDKGHAVSGTAFITRDSLIVTARHCIEPWLNDADVLGFDPSGIVATPSRWALEAETYNQTHDGDTLYRVVSLCTFAGGDKGEIQLGRCLSSAFGCDTSRDDIVEMGDFRHEYYWRSIHRRHGRHDMMLGDIAVAKCDSAGAIRLAADDDIAAMTGEGVQVAFMGYPEYEVGGFELSEGKIKRRYRPGEMIAHDGRLIHGYSGGPVLAVHDRTVCAVGVISVTDARGGDRLYSVPVTERVKIGGER